jgi:RNA polymerase sigma factor (sigma-70 family)
MMVTDPAMARVTCLEARRRMSTLADQVTDASCKWADLMAAIAQRHDIGSFERIYVHFAPRLKRYLLGLGAGETLAAEFAQEALLRLWRRAETFDPRRSTLSTWLFRVTRNLYIDHLRGEPLWSGIEEGMARLEQESAEPACSTTESFTDQVRLRRAIDGLPATEARLIRMSYLEAKSHSEIAAELGMPLGSVKSCLRRAFARLRVDMGVSS